MSNPSKRQRTASNGTYSPKPGTPGSSAQSSLQGSNIAVQLTTGAQAHVPSLPIEDYQSWVGSLPLETVQRLLVQAARTHPDIEGLLRGEVDRLIQLNRAKIVSFDYLSKAAWHTINRSGGSGSEQYEASFDAFESITANIKTIEEGCPEYASFGTKKNGLETLRKIGKSICLGNNDTLGHEIRKQFRRDEDLPNAMLAILDSMAEDERYEVAQSEWGNKLEELIKLANGYCLFEGALDKVLQTLDNEGSGEEDGEGSSEEGGESDAES